MPPPKQASSIAHPVFSLCVCRGSASKEAAVLHFARTAASSSAMQSILRYRERSNKKQPTILTSSCNLLFAMLQLLVAGRAHLYSGFTRRRCLQLSIIAFLLLLLVGVSRLIQRLIHRDDTLWTATYFSAHQTGGLAILHARAVQVYSTCKTSPQQCLPRTDQNLEIVVAE